MVEDAAQSFGAEYKGVKSCNLSHIGCTSFFPSKPLGCYGDGGAIFTSDIKMAGKIRQIARHGQVERYLHTRVGVNSRLDTIQAAILLEKLKVLDDEIYEREAIARHYSSNLAASHNIEVPIMQSTLKSAWAQYTISTKNRDKVKEALYQDGINSTIHYPRPLSEQPAVKSKVEVPNSQLACSCVLSIPIYKGLSKKKQDKIIKIIKCHIR